MGGRSKSGEVDDGLDLEDQRIRGLLILHPPPVRVGTKGARACVLRVDGLGTRFALVTLPIAPVLANMAIHVHVSDFSQNTNSSSRAVVELALPT